MLGLCAAIGGGVILVGYMQTATWQSAAYGQCQRIRVKLLRAIIRQEIGWFDVHETGELNTRLAELVLIRIIHLFQTNFTHTMFCVYKYEKCSVWPLHLMLSSHV